MYDNKNNNTSAELIQGGTSNGKNDNYIRSVYNDGFSPVIQLERTKLIQGLNEAYWHKADN